MTEADIFQVIKDEFAEHGFPRVTVSNYPDRTDGYRTFVVSSLEIGDKREIDGAMKTPGSAVSWLIDDEVTPELVKKKADWSARTMRALLNQFDDPSSYTGFADREKAHDPA